MTLLASIIDTCRLCNASATELLARAIQAVRTGLPGPRLPDIPAVSPRTDLSLLTPQGAGV